MLLSLICTWSFDKNSLHIKDNNNSPHGKFHRFLFPFSSKFPDLNFAPYVLYIYSCYETSTWHKQWAWVSCAQTKPGREAFPNIPGKPEHESNTDISLPDPRKRKRRVCTQAINYYKSKSLSSCAMKQISKWLVLQGTSNMKIVFLKNLTIFFTEADKHRMSAQL